MAALTRHWKTQKRAKEDTEKHSRYGKALRSGKKDSKAPKLMGIALNRMERHKADGKHKNKMEGHQTRWESTKGTKQDGKGTKDTKGTRADGKGTKQMGRHKQVELGNFQTR